MEVSPGSVFLVLDRTERVSAVSARAERAFGIREQTALGCRAEELLGAREDLRAAPCYPPPGTLLVLESHRGP